MGVRRWWGWIAPFGTALLVVVLVFGVHTAMTGGSTGGGPAPDGDDRVARPSPTGPAAPAEPVDLPRDVATLTGYRTVGSRLVLSYRLRYPDCEVIRVQASAAESLDSVVVRLQKVPVARQPLPDCPRGAVRRTVSIRLQQPLSYRPVLDGSRAGHSLPKEG